MTTKLSKLTRRSALILTAVLALVMASGCYLEMDPHDPYYESHVDLQVDWNYQGQDSASVCDVLGVDSWVVELRGPESRNVSASCKGDFWSSENDLFSLEPGHYTVRVKAMNDQGHEVASRQLSADLSAVDGFEQMMVNFRLSDFR